MYLRHCKNYNENIELNSKHVTDLNLSKSEILYIK